MQSRTFINSPKYYARIAGLLYLIVIAGGIFAEIFVRQELLVFNNPSATALNILDNEFLFRLGFAVHLIILFCAAGILFILYNLLKRVNKNAALLMMIFNIISISIEGFSLIYNFEPLFILKNGSLIKELSIEQINALSYLSLKLQSTIYDTALTFFGFFCITVGYLLIKSKFFPGLTGYMMVLAGISYIINSFIHFLAPHLSLFPYIIIPSFTGELTICLWLIIKGLNLKQWEKQVNSQKYE